MSLHQLALQHLCWAAPPSTPLQVCLLNCKPPSTPGTVIPCLYQLSGAQATNFGEVMRFRMGYAGIGRATDLGSMIKMASRPDNAQRWRRATTLIIDEVCMPLRDPHYNLRPNSPMISSIYEPHIPYECLIHHHHHHHSIDQRSVKEACSRLAATDR